MISQQHVIQVIHFFIFLAILFQSIHEVEEKRLAGLGKFTPLTLTCCRILSISSLTVAFVFS